MNSTEEIREIKPANIISKNKTKKNKPIINLYSIKSKYILKFIFSFLKQKIGLNLIYFNKQFRSKLPYDQKKISAKYFEGEKNGYGRIYSLSTKKMIFEGYFHNYKKNGEGKEYDENKNVIIKIQKGKIKELFNNNKLKFIGEYYNNKKWNGIGYDYLGNKQYEIKGGKGIIKEYDYDRKLIFEGEYLDGERNGKGKEIFSNKIKFEGEYLNGERNGKGKEYFLNGKLKFEGEYLNGKRNGKGKEYHFFNGNIIFEGEYLNGERINYIYI